MQYTKRKYRVEDIMDKVSEGKPLEHCEELYHLMRVQNMSEEEAECLLYRSQQTPGRKKMGKKLISENC